MCNMHANRDGHGMAHRPGRLRIRLALPLALRHWLPAACRSLLSHPQPSNRRMGRRNATARFLRPHPSCPPTWPTCRCQPSSRCTRDCVIKFSTSCKWSWLHQTSGSMRSSGTDFVSWMQREPNHRPMSSRGPAICASMSPMMADTRKDILRPLRRPTRAQTQWHRPRQRPVERPRARTCTTSCRNTLSLRHPRHAPSNSLLIQSCDS